MIATPVACVVDASVGIKLVITEALSGDHLSPPRRLSPGTGRGHSPDLIHETRTAVRALISLS